MQELYGLNPKVLWRAFWAQHFSFWMICGYLFFEYVRPQSIYSSLSFLPWTQLCVLGALVGCFTDRSIKWVSNPVNKWMFVFCFFIIASIFFAVYPEISRPRFMDYFSWFIIYFLIINIVNNPQRYFIFLLIFLLATFKISFSMARIWAMRGFSFTRWGLQGPPGFFENSGELAIQMLMFLPISYVFFLTVRASLPKVGKFAILSMPITAAMTIIGASSRGSQIGLVFQAYLLFLKGRLSFKSIVITVLLAVTAYSILPPEQKQRFANTGQDNTSVQRKLYWKHGVEMILEHPWLGVGLFNFPPYYEANFPDDLLVSHAELPHNIFVQVGTDVGIVGLLAYLALLYHGFRSAAQIRKKSIESGAPEFFLHMSKGLNVALWGFIIAGQFVTVTYYPFMWINLAMTVSLLNVLLKDLPSRKAF